MSNNAKVITGLIVAGVAFLIILANFPLVFVGAGHRAVIYNSTTGSMRIVGQGMAFKAPFIESATDMSVQEQASAFDENAGTKDSQSVDVKLTVNWRLDPAFVPQIYQRVGTLDQVQSVVFQNNTQDSLKAATSKFNALEIQQNRDNVAADALSILQAKVKQYHVIVDSLSITNINFTDQFNQAVEAAAQAKQQAIQAENEVAKAKAQAESAVAQAQGQADAQKALQQTLTPEILQQQAIAKWDGHFPQYMLGGNTLPFLNIPTK